MASNAAKRYAQAVFELAKERDAFDAWQTDLTDLTALVTDRRAAFFFADPNVTPGRKTAILDKVLANGQPEARNLAHLLLERDRLAEVPRIATLFEESLRAQRGIAIAEVTTADPLSAASETMIQERLQRLMGKQIELQLQVDPSIIGGIVARVGDLVIDGSVISQLRKLRARLATAS